MNIAHMTMPSALLMKPSKNAITNKSNATARLIGMSRVRSNLLTLSLLMIAEAPMMTRVLKMLLPMMLPTLMSLLPRNTLKKLTMNSGRLVPMDTIVRPITNSLTCHFLAIPHAPSVNRSAPHNTSAMPNINKIQFNTIKARSNRYRWQIYYII